MYTGAWEIVGKNKRDKSNGKAVLSKTEKKKFIENSPKVEDFLPLAQVKTLYDNLDGNKENKKPPKEKENKSKENDEKKKQQKQQQTKREEPKEKIPKSIEEAVTALNAAELQNLLENSQLRFPDAPLIWLKDLVSFLNLKIPIDYNEPMFSGKPDGYPSSVVPKSVRLVLEKAIELAGPLNAQLFYEFNLTSMAMDMSKGTPVIGYKIFIQLLAKHNPTLAVTNISKLVSLRNSYQNRKPVGLSLLWAFAQSGIEDLQVGLKVWCEVMVPMLETKSYSIYVLRILSKFLTIHEKDGNLSVESYLNIFDLLSGKLNIPVMHVNEAAEVIAKLRAILFNNKSVNYKKLFETLLTRVTPKSSDVFRNESVQALAKCLGTDERCFEIWQSLYVKHLYISSILLKFIVKNFTEFRSTVKPKVLKGALEVFQSVEEKGKKGKGKDDGYLTACKDACKVLMKKSKASRRGGFPWKTGSFILLVLIGSIVAYDTHKHGSFEASSIGKVLRDTGVTSLAQKSWSATKSYTNKGLGYIEASSPEYYKAVVDFSTPYAKLVGDAYVVSKNLSTKLYGNVATYVSTTAPVVVAKIEQYAPGLCDSIQQQASNGVNLVKKYSILIAEQTVENSVKAVRWLETNVFVGKLSPESLQSYASQAINSTQAFASQTYDWVYEKVQTFSKVQ